LLGRSHAADDVAQETFFRLWTSGMGHPGEPRATMAWLYRTCTRLAIDALRAGRRTDGGDVSEEDMPCTADLGARTEAKAAIVALATSVPSDELLVAVLCRVDGLSQPEAASVAGISERTVRRVLDRFDARVDSLRKEYLS
jgi:RNA polymerase sigma-70 factor (ECF subfamily)